LGRRIEKVANGQTTRYIYDGEDILLEYDGSNVLQARYTHGPGIDEPLAVTKGGATFFYHQDGLGTVTDLTDSAGATAKSYSYDAYGTIVDQTGTVEQPYTYTGRELDTETGLYYYRVRYYDSTTGRFLQKDPIGSFLRYVNLHAYVGENPVNGVDPLGLFNPVKGASAVLNASIAGVSAASGAAKILIAAGISPAATTGVGALPPTALYIWGTWNIKSAKAATERALQQWQEAICEDWSQAAWKNLYGALPGGTHYDDPDEPNGPWDYIKNQGWWKFFSDLGYF
jgi:RHS repeat-associated protein